MNRQTQLIETSKIYPDPNQPRKYFPEDAINDIAMSFKTVGILEPIEIDPQFMIIFGEKRWRAAKVAGLEKIPAMIYDVGKDERFMRQVVENIHHNTMTGWETANALWKLVQKMPEKSNTARIAALAKKIGASERLISTALKLLQETDPAIVSYIQKPHAKWRVIVKVSEFGNKISSETQQALKEKIIRGELGNEKVLSEIIRGITTHPEKTEEFLNADFSMGESGAIRKAHMIEGLTQDDEDTSIPLQMAQTLKRTLDITKLINVETMSMFRQAEIDRLLQILVPRLYNLQNQLKRTVQLPESIE